VELLVVIAIMAVLLTLLTPALRKAREQGRGVKCLAHIKNYGKANLEYADEDPVGRVVWQAWLQTPKFLELLGLDPLQIEENMLRWGTAPFGEEHICPSSKVARRGMVDLSENIDSNTGMAATYGQNHSLRIYDPRPYYASGHPDEYTPFFKLDNIPRPGEKIMFLDAADISVNSIIVPYTSPLSAINPFLFWDKYGDLFMFSTTPMAMGVVSYRHGERANVMYYDGHAAPAGKGQLWVVNPYQGSDNATMRMQWYLGRD
jgi:prepilin-type processing-associated H-X9-DG protein